MDSHRIFGHLHRVGLSFLLVGALSLAGIAAPASAQEADPDLPSRLVEVSETLAKYQDPYRAVHDGYFSTVGCVDYPDGGGEGQVPYPAGAMGVHFLNPALLDGEVDPMKPEVLVYDRSADGTLTLAAAEWMVPKEAAEERPRLFGEEFDGPMAGHHPLMPRGFHHYDLHIWLWRDNPEGLYAPTNPAMSCPDEGYTVEEEAPALVGESHHDAG